MPKIFNEKNINYRINQNRAEDFSWHSAGNLAKLVGAQHLNFSFRSLDPNKFSYPYHYHHNAEEIFVILSGKAELRTPSGITKVAEGDVIYFEIGEEGAHQLYNHTKEPCVFIDISTNMGFDVCEYPDSRKIGITSKREIIERGLNVDYFSGEETVKKIWDKIRD